MRIVKSIYHEFEKYHWTKKTIIILTILGVLVLIVNFMIYTKNIQRSTHIYKYTHIYTNIYNIWSRGRELCSSRRTINKPIK